MNRVAITTVALLVAAAAVVHGAVTQRWSVFAPDPARTARAHALVVRFADCESVEVPSDIPLKERSVATCRKYHSDAQNLTVVTSITTGVPGAVATHTPDVCYTGGGGYVMLRGPAKQSVELPGGGTAEYYVADFERKKAAGTDRVRVRWAWTADGTWAAPDRPRWAYARVPELFKLYIVTTLPDADGGDDPPAVRGFVAAALAQHAEAVAAR
jgi:hypothetical protein